MKISEIFEDPGKIESNLERIVDGPDPLRRAVNEAIDQSKRDQHENQLETMRKIGEKVIKRTKLGEMFPEHKLFRVSRNGKEEFREYLLDYGKFGILFDFRNDKVTTHT